MEDGSIVQHLGGRVHKGAGQPAHLQVRQRILAAIHASGLGSGDPIPSEVDLAEVLGVSRMTANKAVLALVAEGWLTRHVGRGTFVAEAARRGLARCVILIKPSAASGARDDHYYGGLYWGIREQFMASDVRLDVAALTPDALEGLADLGDTGIIALNPDREGAALLSSWACRGVPVTVLGSSWESGHLDSVDSDNLLGAALAVSHLVDLGHTRIGFAGAFQDDSNTQDRLHGFRIATKSRGIVVPDEDLYFGDDLGELSPESQDRLTVRLSRPDGVTAMVVGGANLALQVLGIATRIGRAVPESLSIVAYDDPKFLTITHPPLTTIRQPLDEMAAQACSLLTQRRMNPSDGYRQILFDPSLVVRQSTAPAYRHDQPPRRQP